MKRRISSTRWFFCFATLLFLLLAAGCSPIARAGQTNLSDIQLLDSKRSIGQTFTANYNGLAGIAVYISEINPSDEGQLIFHLRASPFDSQDLAREVIPFDQIPGIGYTRFEFPVISHSNQSGYYFFIELTGNSAVKIGTAPGDDYLEGAMYIDGQPVDQQMAFQLVYQPAPALLGIGQEILGWIKVLLASGFLFILPGWVLLSAVWIDWKDRDALEKTALAVGVSLAIYPTLFFWTRLVGLNLGPAYAWGPPALAALWGIWRNRKTKAHFPRFDASSSEAWGKLSALMVLVLVIIIRFWVVRGLDVPLWGDSYHHTMIVQLMLDNGGMFDSWQPYAPLESLTYHFGFHSQAAVFSWVTGFSAPQSVLWYGQIANVFAVLALYPLALKIQRNAWAGSLTLLVAGLLSSYPMTYTSWGRYTQLAGQAVLPIAAWLVWEAFEKYPRSWRAWLVVSLIWASLGFIHYRIFLVGLFFILVLLIRKLLKHPPIQDWSGLAVAGASGLILVLPWFIKVFSGKIKDDLIYRVSMPASSVPDWLESYNQMLSYLDIFPAVIWLIFFLVIVWMAWKHRSEGFAILLWAVVALFATNPAWLNLPGTGLISNFAYQIMAYLWISPIIGVGLAYLLEHLRWSRLPPAIIPLSLFILFGLVGGLSLTDRKGNVEVKEYQLFTSADLRASTWIEANTPPSSLFLVNTITAYAGYVVAGSDGGWWLPLMAHRETNLPPMTYSYEKASRADYTTWVLELPKEIASKGITNPDIIRQLKERGITYIYIGQRQGSANLERNKGLDIDQLVDSPYFTPVYHQDRVYIFSINP